MDNIITGAIAVAIFLAFVLGLAQSIGQLPFFVIVVGVGALLCIDFFQSAREGLQSHKQDNSGTTD
jgi:hypothetical protein